ncbi:MAG TPA: PAS domain S-box protein [Terriglobales bacterium]|nr:PAS domain S-box protein [Terriglobales bacterium]
MSSSHKDIPEKAETPFGIAEALLGQSNLWDLAVRFLEGSSQSSSQKSSQSSVELSQDRLPTPAERYQILVEQIPAVVFLVFLDAGLSEAYVSPQIEHLLGFSREEWLDDPIRWYGQLHAEDKQRWSVEVADLVMTGRPLRSEYRVVARNGRVVWFRCEAKLVRRNDGEPWFVHGVGFDITDLKRTEEALQAEMAERRRLEKIALERQIAKTEQTEDLLQQLIDSMSDSLLLVDSDGHILRTNGAMCELLHRKPGEIQGSTLPRLFPNLEIPSTPAQLLQRSPERPLSLEAEVALDDSSVIQAGISCSLVRDRADRVLGLLLVISDLTERKRAEEALRTTEKLAAAGRLAATIAHEVNNPLEAVTNLLYLARNNPEQAGKYLDMADHELMRMSHITKQTLGFYRDATSPVKVETSRILEDLLLLYSSKLLRRKITVKKDYRNHAVIKGFAGEIRQVFANIIGNSIDAMQQGGALTVRSSRTRNWRGEGWGVRLSIADTGTGISSEHLKKIFEPFYTTKKEVGTGLGLWVTKTIVERHGGRIKVCSRTEEGHSGSVFSVFLPENFEVASQSQTADGEKAISRPTALLKTG